MSGLRLPVSSKHCWWFDGNWRAVFCLGQWPETGQTVAWFTLSSSKCQLDAVLLVVGAVWERDTQISGD